MLKEISFQNTPVVVKYLLPIITIVAIFIGYVVMQNQANPGTKSAVSAANVVRGALPTPVPSVKASELRTTERVGLPSDTDNLRKPSIVSSEVQSAFQAATAATQQGDFQSAVNVLAGLIEQHPELPEPYANLASLQAASGQLAEARATLLQGLNANQGYGALFSNLQKVQGALAANAYRTALAEQGKAIKTVDLPVFENIELPEGPQPDVAAVVTAEQQISVLQQQLDELKQALYAAKQQRLQRATAELQAAEQELIITQ